MKGYYNNQEATNNVIDKDGWLHSGDLAVKTKDSFYKITGRITDMIVRGGENIYPREIENYLKQMRQIETVEIAAVTSKKYGRFFIESLPQCTVQVGPLSDLPANASRWLNL